MRLRLLCLAPALLAGACGGGDDTGAGGPPTIEAVEPDFGPLDGGTRVVITGSGFLSAGAPPNRVLIGGREAAQAGVVDDSTLEVVIPAADSPGDVTVVVFNENGYVSGDGLFHYSTPPAITGVTPGEVLYTDLEAQITVTGSGFVDEDAGPVRVLVNGLDAIDLEVQSDTELSFTARPGAPLARGEIQVINRRGEATDPGFRYVPSFADGLIVFTRGVDTFAVFYDPAGGSTVEIPRRTRGGGGGSANAMRSVTVDENGDFWAFDRQNRFGILDFGEQEIVDGLTNNNVRIPELLFEDGTLYGLDRSGGFGEVDTATGNLTTIGTSVLNCCSRYGLAVNSAGQAFVLHPNTIQTINLETGVLGTPVTMTPSIHVSGARFLGTTLYAIASNGGIYTINTSTGVTSLLATLPGGGASAMEVLQ